MKTINRIFFCPLLLMGLMLMLTISCKKENNNNNSTLLPVLTTNTVTNITSSSAVCGGIISGDGGSTVTARGVCWSTGQSPTIANNKTTDGTGAGSFTSNITGLTANTTYYVRAYATNSNGTGYGAAMSFTAGHPTAPVITLLGSANVLQDLHTTYTDAGATAFDNIDGNITVRIVVTGFPVNTDQCGETMIRFNVSNIAGDPAIEVTRSVKIKSDLLAGYYSVSEHKGNYDVTVTQSTTVFNKVLINNFGGYGTSITLEAIVDGTTVTVPAQNISQGTDVYIIQGTGTYSGALNKILTITYTETLPPNAPTTYIATYTKL